MSNYIKEAVDGDGNCCDDCSRDNPCDSCNTPSVAVTCTSWTATPTLCGFSAYVDENAGPIYKWNTRTLSGEQKQRSGCNDCGVDDPYNSRGGIFSGSITITCAGEIANTGVLNVSEDFTGSCSAPDYIFTVLTSALAPYVYGGAAGDCATDNWSLTTTQTSLTYVGCECAGPNAPFEWYSGTLQEVLSEPDTIEDAIDRATPTEGNSCCAETGIVGSTTAKSTSPISVGESTKVTLSITVHGDPSTAYTVRIHYTNSVKSTGAPLADTYEDVLMTTDGSGDAVVSLNIAQPGSDRRCCFDHAEILP